MNRLLVEIWVLKLLLLKAQRELRDMALEIAGEGILLK